MQQPQQQPQQQQPPPGYPTQPAQAPPPAYPPQPPAYPPAAYPPQSYPPPAGYGPSPEPPRTLPYEEGQPIPEGYILTESVRRGPVIAGAIVFGVPYVLSVSVATGNQMENATGWLLIPGVGPFITLASREDNCDPINDGFCDTEDEGERTLLTLDGLMQTTGLVLLIWGLASKTKRLVRYDAAKVWVTPTRIGEGYGLGAVGRF